jgi:hypothetical protein
VDLTLENGIKKYMSELCKGFWFSAAERVSYIQQALQRSDGDGAALRSVSVSMTELFDLFQDYLQQSPQPTGQQWVTEIHRLLRLLVMDIQFVVTARQVERRAQRLKLMDDRLHQLSAYIEKLLDLL